MEFSGCFVGGIKNSSIWGCASDSLKSSAPLKQQLRTPGWLQSNVRLIEFLRISSSACCCSLQAVFLPHTQISALLKTIVHHVEILIVKRYFLKGMFFMFFINLFSHCFTVVLSQNSVRNLNSARCTFRYASSSGATFNSKSWWGCNEILPLQFFLYS